MQASLVGTRSSLTTAEKLELLSRRLFKAATGSEYLRAIEDTGLTLTQVKGLVLLTECSWAQEAPISVNQVSERLGLSMAATSRAIDGLSRKGLVKRTEDPSDRRVRRIAPTRKGERLINELIEFRRVGLESFVEALSPEQIDKLETALDSVLGDEA